MIDETYPCARCDPTQALHELSHESAAHTLTRRRCGFVSFDGAPRCSPIHYVTHGLS